MDKPLNVATTLITLIHILRNALILFNWFDNIFSLGVWVHLKVGV